jgi:hypothetical protein
MDNVATMWPVLAGLLSHARWYVCRCRSLAREHQADDHRSRNRNRYQDCQSDVLEDQIR